MKSEPITVRSEGMTVSRIIWQFLRRQPPGYLEQVLVANPGLADKGPLLPVGTVINMPLEAIPPVQQPRKLVRLFD